MELSEPLLVIASGVQISLLDTGWKSRWSKVSQENQRGGRKKWNTGGQDGRDQEEYSQSLGKTWTESGHSREKARDRQGNRMRQEKKWGTSPGKKGDAVQLSSSSWTTFWVAPFIETSSWLTCFKTSVHLCINQFSSFCPCLRNDCPTYLAFRISSISFKKSLPGVHSGWVFPAELEGSWPSLPLQSPCYFLQQRCVWRGRAGTLTLVKWTDREGSAWLVGNCHIIKNNFAFIPRRKTTVWKPQTSLF